MTPTKLAVAVVQIDDVHDLMAALSDRGLSATRIEAAGGFLRHERAIILVATDDAGLAAFQSGVRQTCRTRMATWVPAIEDGTVGLYAEPIEVEVGGAVIFVLPIERVDYLSQVPAFSGQGQA